MAIKTALVCGADGFIGHHLVARLKREGFWVRGIDLVKNTYAVNQADELIMADLRDPTVCETFVDQDFDEVYQFAADMGGAGYLFVGEHDADIMSNSMQINLNLLNTCKHKKIKRLLFASSACVYPEHNQTNPNHPHTAEDSTYPAAPDSEYGWEKLFSERLYAAYARCYQIPVRIARFHNIFGPECSWNNGKEKSLAALCRKILCAGEGDAVEIWGDGEQTRSYLFIDECLQGIRRLMDSTWSRPLNIGSAEMISINDLAKMIMRIAHKKVLLKYIPGPLGVRGRTSDNRLIKKILQWEPTEPLQVGLEKTYQWIAMQVTAKEIA